MDAALTRDRKMDADKVIATLKTLCDAHAPQNIPIAKAPDAEVFCEPPYQSVHHITLNLRTGLPTGRGTLSMTYTYEGGIWRDGGNEICSEPEYDFSNFGSPRIIPRGNIQVAYDPMLSDRPADGGGI